MIISSIDKKNRSIIEHLMPEDSFRKLELPHFFALCALEDKEENQKEVAGVLVFSADKGSVGTEEWLAATIQWLYVEPEYRGTQTANRLMESFWDVMDKSGIEHILCDIPFPEEYNRLCAYLESWGFRFFLMERYLLTVPLQKFKEIHTLHGSYSSRVRPLRQVTQADFNLFLPRILELPGVFQQLPTSLSAYEGDVSCVCMGSTGIEGALLVRKAAEDLLELLLLRSLFQPQKIMAELSSFALRAAENKYPPDIMVQIDCRSGASADVLSKLFPNAQPLLVRRGYYDNRIQQTTEPEKEEPHYASK